MALPPSDSPYSKQKQQLGQITSTVTPSAPPPSGLPSVGIGSLASFVRPTLFFHQSPSKPVLSPPSHLRNKSHGIHKYLLPKIVNTGLESLSSRL
ncbi:uncharacterized protein STEHIDRAFT_156529 [Stereum hirsutum FP-91666 SS1]|uniref:uncharacterized protein n=1 Tax=Stereum hirsutum (strain FP-91666) TaxID=721885 RepID=UPI000440B34A|nr:uncharacterized protein STEHIDRAFT_156529 [Stereum hirsutum FP-91666 SS1]EIM87574.1 hypothetical protein STEHIDRAFT_156529 [Stereum hirsutum FP-91666 SS1]